MNPGNTKPYKIPEDATWLITGCSSGIGKAIANLIANKPGQRLVATARNINDLSYLPESKDILKLRLDVTDVKNVDDAFAKVKEVWGEYAYLDIVVNNAGYSLSGDTESATEEETHREMETLFFGTTRVATRAISIMRVPREDGSYRGGVIFNITSLAGLVGFPGHAYYHAGKFAVEGWSESVAKEMHPDWNINISIIEPSGVQTNFEGHSKAHTAPHPAYTAPDMPARVLEKYVNAGIKARAVRTTPEMIAEALWCVVQKGKNIPLRLPLGKVAWQMSKAKFEGLLQTWNEVKGMSFLGEE